jgi:hypothetical protein
MSKRFAGSKCGTSPTTVATRAMTATIVMPKISFRASPTPYRWIPMKMT